MDFSTPEPIHSELFVDGEAVRTVDTTAIVDPARPGVVVGFAAAASPEDIERAVDSAHRAATLWGSLSVRARADTLAEAIAGLDSRRDEIAEILSLEIGKPRHESWVDAKVFEIRWNLALRLADSVVLESVLEPDATTPNRTIVQRRPVGPVTIIVPFNWPLAIVAASLPHALLAGNPVIVKVPASAPLAASMFLSAVAAALPAGVLNVISGRDETMSPLIADPRIAKVCFTGSVNGGKEISRIAAGNVTRLTLELGGNDPAVICADAELDSTALDRLFSAVFDTSGQICMNVKRIYVHETRRDELLEGFRELLRNVRLGHGLDPETTHGPVHTARQAMYIRDLIVEARAAGASVEQFGVIPGGELADGHFVAPTLVIDPPHTSRIVTEEQFGPVIPVISFTTDDEAIAAANNTWAGLGASVWTSDSVKARQIADALKVGYVWINDHGAPRLDLRAPFGGTKHSGYGREQGIDGILEFTESRAISTIPVNP